MIAGSGKRETGNGKRGVRVAGPVAVLMSLCGVPVVMITGDDQIVSETKQRLGSLEGVAVKRAIGFHSTATLTPPNVQRIDSHTVRFTGNDMIEVSKFLEFLTSYDPTLTP